MTMAVAQVRLPRKVLEDVDSLVSNGRYSDRSDVIRHSIRILLLNEFVGITKGKGDSVKEAREIKKKLSKEPIDLDEINGLCPR